MFEYVKDIGLKPRSAYAKRKKTDLIILHHFATDASPKAVHLYHKAIGHKGIDYNMVVCLDGTAVWGRGIEYEGGHVRNYGPSAGMNQRSIGIACQGNFDLRTMPAAQKATLLRVIRDCLKAYPDIGQILGHKEVKATACPGKNFPLAEAKRLLLEPVETTIPPTEIYRVRKSWASAKSQIGAFHDLPNARALADKNPAYTVYDSDGDVVYKPRTMVPAPAPTPPAPKFRLKRLLKRGSNGSDVAAVQAVLKQLGYFKFWKCTGKFASITLAAVKAFQRAHGLVVDGVVGAKTCAALGGVWVG